MAERVSEGRGGDFGVSLHTPRSFSFPQSPVSPDSNFSNAQGLQPKFKKSMISRFIGEDSPRPSPDSTQFPSPLSSPIPPQISSPCPSNVSTPSPSQFLSTSLTSVTSSSAKVSTTPCVSTNTPSRIMSPSLTRVTSWDAKVSTPVSVHIATPKSNLVLPKSSHSQSPSLTRNPSPKPIGICSPIPSHSTSNYMYDFPTNPHPLPQVPSPKLSQVSFANSTKVSSQSAYKFSPSLTHASSTQFSHPKPSSSLYSAVSCKASPPSSPCLSFPSPHFSFKNDPDSLSSSSSLSRPMPALEPIDFSSQRIKTSPSPIKRKYEEAMEDTQPYLFDKFNYPMKKVLCKDDPLSPKSEHSSIFSPTPYLPSSLLSPQSISSASPTPTPLSDLVSSHSSPPLNVLSSLTNSQLAPHLKTALLSPLSNAPPSLPDLAKSSLRQGDFPSQHPQITYAKRAYALSHAKAQSEQYYRARSNHGHSGHPVAQSNHVRSSHPITQSSHPRSSYPYSPMNPTYGHYGLGQMPHMLTQHPALLRPTHTWQGGGIIERRSTNPSLHNQLNISFPPPRFTAPGNANTGTMKSDIPYPLTGQSPTTPLRQPTACYKHVDLGQLYSDEELFQKKPISKWEESEIRGFMMAGLSEFNIKYVDLDFNFGKLKKQTGMQLLARNVSWFMELSADHGHDLYQKFVEYRDWEERRRQRDREVEMYTNNQYTTGYTLPFETPPHHQPLHETSTSMEISAPHEFKYLPLDNNSGVGSAGTATGGRMVVEQCWPTAMSKPFPNLDCLSPGALNPDTPGTPEEPIPEVPKKRGPGRPRKPENELKKKKKKTGRLWEFIRNLLLDPVTCPSMVRWENHDEGMFRFVQAEKVAKKWGDRKGNDEMNYEKLSRAMRYYYKTEIFEAVLGRRLVYKFGKNAKGWQPSDPNFLNYHHAAHAHSLSQDLT